MIDHWEVDGDLVSLEEELGEGAFGKVYKGILKELNSPSRKPSMMPPISTIRKNTLKQTEGFTVAVKMLHGELHLSTVVARTVVAMETRFKRHATHVPNLIR